MKTAVLQSWAPMAEDVCQESTGLRVSPLQLLPPPVTPLPAHLRLSWLFPGWESQTSFTQATVQACSPTALPLCARGREKLLAQL